MDRKHYKVAVAEMFRKTVIVDAKTPSEAHQRVSDAWANTEITLDDRDFAGAEFYVLGETENPDEDLERVEGKND